MPNALMAVKLLLGGSVAKTLYDCKHIFMINDASWLKNKWKRKQLRKGVLHSIFFSPYVIHVQQNGQSWYWTL